MPNENLIDENHLAQIHDNRLRETEKQRRKEILNAISSVVVDSGNMKFKQEEINNNPDAVRFVIEWFPEK